MAVADEVLPRALEGERVDRVVSLLTGCSRAEAVAAIKAGGVSVDGTAAGKGSIRVHEGQRVVVSADPITPAATARPAADVDFDVVHEDDDVIVIDKPAGLVTHPGAGHGPPTLAEGLLHRYPEVADVGDPLRPGIVHRLDKGTSGLLVAARSRAAHDTLVTALARHEIERRYSAMCWGEFEHPRGTIDAPIGRSRRDPVKRSVAADGKPARTHYAVERRFELPKPGAQLGVTLETGRTHQIRVHLRSIGHPVVGDTTYGGATWGLPITRPFLHSAQLGFSHPVTGERLDFESALPDDLAEVVSLTS